MELLNQSWGHKKATSSLITENEQIQKIVEYLKTDSSNNWASFVNDVKQGDEYRNESFKDTFPEYYQMLLSHDKTI